MVKICRSYGQLSTGLFFVKHGVYLAKETLMDWPCFETR